MDMLIPADTACHVHVRVDMLIPADTACHVHVRVDMLIPAPISLRRQTSPATAAHLV
ncbi:MAG: hypothetical protein IT424_07840 [Pirellulales bacterium]|nr:hypothetical protein [Pirellulales bacterium]